MPELLGVLGAGMGRHGQAWVLCMISCFYMTSAPYLLIKMKFADNYPYRAVMLGTVTLHLTSAEVDVATDGVVGVKRALPLTPRRRQDQFFGVARHRRKN